MLALAALTACDEATSGHGGGARDGASASVDGATADATVVDDAGIDARAAGSGASDDAGARDAASPIEPGAIDGSTGDAGTSRDAGGATDGSTGDAGPASLGVAGLVLDAWTASTVEAAQVSAEHNDPAVDATSNASGEYAFELPEGSLLVPLVTHTSYRATRNPAVSITAALDLDVHGVSTADASRQYTNLGMVPSSGTALVIAEICDGSGDPITGIPLADITLVDGGSQPVGLGPYYFGAAGDLEPAASLSTSSAFDGRARVGFLDCPPGEHELRVSLTSGTLHTAVTCSADGATLVVPE